MRGLVVCLRGLTLFVAGIVVGTVMMQPSAAQENKTTGLRLNHVGIAVTNLQETLNFYTKVMGFHVAYTNGRNGQPGNTFLQISRDTFLEVAQAGGNAPAGITHIGIGTEDADASVAQLRQAGATVPDVRPGGPSGSRLSNVTDPNGIRLELNEQPADSLMRKAIDSWK
jgi:catechol 2,3-dioxygenase-like lactoylglutathione lyase family enzyme